MTKRKAVKEFGDKVLIPLGVAAAGGVAANQVPQNQKSTKKAMKKVERQIAKHFKPVKPVVESDLPYFNHEYAQTMANLVSKMDDETADMFTYLVMHDVLEQDMERNQRTLQAHINEVVAKRISDLKKVTKTLVSKSDDEDVWEFAQALVEIEKAVQNPYEFGNYKFEESDFRRDPGTGRFMQKVTYAGDKAKPLSDKSVVNLGLNPKDAKYKKLTDTQKAQFQHEYMQVVNFLNTAQNFGGSETDVRIRVFQEQNEKYGNPGGSQYYWKKIEGKPKVGEDWDPTIGERVVAVEAQPKGGLSLGGAAFGLPGALSGESLERINALDQTKFKSFSNDWTKNDFDTRNSNEKLYHRTKTGSQFVMDMSPEKSSIHRAARFGLAVGEHGAEAEKVFGPASRKAAYRYRGTEKTPDAVAVQQFNMAVNRAKTPALGEDQRKQLLSRQKRAVTLARGRKAEQTKTPVEAVTLSPDEIRSVRGNVEARFMEQVSREASPAALGAGREVLATYLMTTRDKGGNAPSKGLYGLQLKSGVTPPSEGFILDKQGKVVVQASGYGDDHYLPFNLKHLAKLRGGEYIRTRSVGGPTAEDIYTGLMAGAKQITVVSRSGTFTVEFEEDFKGKRRYNDKAARMIRRYEHLLDTVQSEQVERPQQISPEVRRFLAADVDRRFSWADRPTKRQEMKNAIEAYKSELQMTGEDEQEFEQFFRDVASDLPENQQQALRSQMYNDWQSQNEFKFRLNGAGYRDALIALQEQFPYYFKTNYAPRKELERIETERDRGYVEPARNRPTEANGGWYGTSTNKGEQFSASRANYQRGRYHAKGATAALDEPEGTDQQAEVTSTPVGGGGITPTGARNDEIVERAAERQQEHLVTAKAVNLRRVLGGESMDATIRGQHPILNLSENDFETRMGTPEGRAEFEKFTDQYGVGISANAASKEALNEYIKAAASVDLERYSDLNSHRWGNKPFKFDGPEFKKTANRQQVEHALNQIDHRHAPVSASARYSEMSEGQMKKELTSLIDLKSNLADFKDVNAEGTARMLTNMELEPKEDTMRLIHGGPDAIQRQVKALHQARSMKANLAGMPKPVAPPAAPGATPENPLETGTRRARGSVIDKVNRDRLAQIREKIKEARIFADAQSNPENQEWFDSRMDDIANQEAMIDAALNSNVQIPMAAVHAANEDLAKIGMTMIDFGEEDE